MGKVKVKFYERYPEKYADICVYSYFYKLNFKAIKISWMNKHKGNREFMVFKNFNKNAKVLVSCEKLSLSFRSQIFSLSVFSLASLRTVLKNSFCLQDF